LKFDIDAAAKATQQSKQRQGDSAGTATTAAPPIKNDTSAMKIDFSILKTAAASCLKLEETNEMEITRANGNFRKNRISFSFFQDNNQAQHFQIRIYTTDKFAKTIT
jgi:outer membrane receptor for ferrienterochelin and colicin